MSNKCPVLFLFPHIIHVLNKFIKISLISRMICMKGIVLFLFPHRIFVLGYLLDLPQY